MKLEQHVRYLDLELHQAQDEIARLTKSLGEKGYHARRVKLAYEDALLMAKMHSVYIYPSRSFMMARCGFTQTRFQNAYGLLRMAKLVVGRNHWVSRDFLAMQKRLEATMRRALADEELYKIHLPRHGRR